MRHQLDRCGAAPEFLLKLAPQEWDNILVDPHGRWVATVRKCNIEVRGHFNAVHVDEEVFVRDTAGGRQIARFRAPRGIRGLTSSPDGVTIRGLTAAPAKEDNGPSVNFGGDPVSFSIPQGSLRVLVPGHAPDSAACKVEDETPEARQVLRSVRMLESLWALPTDKQSKVFTGSGNTLWLDAGATIATLDPLTGKTLRRFPSGRTDDTARFAAPHSGGFLTAAGDTLSWVPFVPRAGAGQGRGVIDHRPGWQLGQLHLQGRGVVGLWSASEHTRVRARSADGVAMRALVVTYDAKTLRAVGRRALQEDELGMMGDYTERPYAEAYFPMCADSVGRMTTGYDWRLSHFDSFRLVACGLGTTQTVLWSHLDVQPRPLPETFPSFEQERAVLGRDAQLAVARDGGLLRVFDSTSRSEVAQISLAGKGAPVSTVVIATDGLILVEAGVQRESGPSREVTAYSIRPCAAAGANKK